MGGQPKRSRRLTGPKAKRKKKTIIIQRVGGKGKMERQKKARLAARLALLPLVQQLNKPCAVRQPLCHSRPNSSVRMAKSLPQVPAGLMRLNHSLNRPCSLAGRAIFSDYCSPSSPPPPPPPPSPVKTSPPKALEARPLSDPEATLVPSLEPANGRGGKRKHVCFLRPSLHLPKRVSSLLGSW